MPTQKLNNRTEVEDFVRGCTFFATGGGGLPANGIKSLMGELEAGRQVGWVDIGEIPDSALSVCPFLMGSIAPHTKETIDEMASYRMTDQTSVYPEGQRLAAAIGALEEYSGKKFDVIVPVELAGANTAGAMAAGSQRGMITVDGDYTGRAIPEIVQITFNYDGHPILPIASVDEWGNECIIKNGINARTIEHIGKLISVAGYGLAGQAGLALDVAKLRKTLIPGTLSECYDTGKLLREAKEAGRDPVKELVGNLGGFELGRGVITIKDDYDKEGYYWGYVTVDCGGFKLKYWFKNENHVLWKDDVPFVTSPDIIAAVDTDTWEPVPNPLSHTGQKVALVALPCKPQQETTDLLTPRYFGFDIDHIPLKKVMAGR
ncbi:MAG: DUF917 domain-containing protein [Synergistaceae bacterium]|jgi:DUF917 family protein|nr:DUF917 domain-containing protein [Synergistaceae bacterium]